jgi:hypothetical protein
MGLTVTLVATIVAGEVGGTVPSARLPVACTVVRDHRRGLDLDRRWYGRQPPTAADVAAARRALRGGCDHLPYFRLLGNDRDMETWRELGYLQEEDHVWRWEGVTGWAVAGVTSRDQDDTSHSNYRLTQGGSTP